MYKFVLENLPSLPRISTRLLNKYVWLTLLITISTSQIISLDTKFIISGSRYILHYLKISPMPVFGPRIEFEIQNTSTYNFSLNRKSFNGHFPLKSLSSIDKNKLRSLLVSDVPSNVKERMTKYVDTALTYSAINKIDPLWVLSIIWVESHFKPKAKSSVGAAGLMQIMPKTGVYLNKLQKIDLPLSVSYETSYDPIHNILLGSFYLKKLLKRFSGNYVYATVAYNMGPTYTRRRLKQRKSVGRRNQYLIKVRKAYQTLSKPVQQYLGYKDKPSRQSIAVR